MAPEDDELTDSGAKALVSALNGVAALCTFSGMPDRVLESIFKSALPDAAVKVSRVGSELTQLLVEGPVRSVEVARLMRVAAEVLLTKYELQKLLASAAGKSPDE